MKKYQKFLAAFLAVCAFSSSAKAGGYQLNDYSVTGLGRAYAGAGIVGDDYSAIAFNPAGMTLAKKSGFQAGLTMVNLKADVDSIDARAPGAHKKMDFWTPIPQFFGQYNVNDKFSVGLGIYAPFGLKTQYDADWFGKNTAILSKLDVIDTNVAMAYKINKKWSVGAGLVARYIYGHMTNDLSVGGHSDFELDGWTKTGLLGVMYEPTENTRFGFSWRLRSTQQVKGDHKVSGTSGTVIGALTGMPIPENYFNETATGWASPALPETFTLAAYHKYKNVGLSGTIRWTHWSQSFPEFSMISDSRLFGALSASPLGAASGVANGQKTSLYNYDNTWTITAGLDWYYNENWTFRCGTGWDESPTHNNISRTIRIPDNDRFWTSVGASYITENWQIDVAYARMFGRSGIALETSDPSAMHVKYKKLRSNLVGLQVQYKF